LLPHSPSQRLLPSTISSRMSSPDLEWLLLRKYSSTLVKGRGLPTFTREHGNLKNIHTPVYSGHVGNPVIIKLNKAGEYEVSHRKSDASPHHVKEAHETQTFKKNAGLHTALKAAVDASNNGQRPELSRAAAARTFALANSRRTTKTKSRKTKTEE